VRHDYESRRRCFWRRLTGRALDGPHEGAQLASATDVSELYWAAWFKFHPDTAVYGE
jgi:hypothetical protein